MALVDQIKTVINSISNKMPQVKEQRTTTTHFSNGGCSWWQGEAGNTFRNKYDVVKNRMKAMEGQSEELSSLANNAEPTDL